MIFLCPFQFTHFVELLFILGFSKKSVDFYYFVSENWMENLSYPKSDLAIH
jgi:hypothetical protein